MKVLNALNSVLRFVIEGVGKIFAPNEEHYPATGVVPFSGEPYQQK